MPSTSTITYFVIVIGMTLYMIIAEWLGNIENIKWMKMFFDKTDTHGNNGHITKKRTTSLFQKDMIFGKCHGDAKKGI